MAYLAITAAQVDADSPLDATLFGQIRDNDIYMKAEKIERDGSIPMTGTLDTNGNNITLGGGLLDTEAGNIDMGGGDLDTEGGDITVQNITINGTMSGAAIVNSVVKYSLAGTTETAAAGTIKDTTKTIDFTTYLTGDIHWVFAPTVLPYLCPIVAAITDVDNVTTKYTTNGDTTAVDYGNGEAYEMIEGGEWVQSKAVHTTPSGGDINASFSMNSMDGGINRSWIRLTYSHGTTGTSDITLTYGGEADLIMDDSSNTTDAVCYIKMKDGTNTLTLTSVGGNVNSTSVLVEVDHVTKFAEAAA